MAEETRNRLKILRSKKKDFLAAEEVCMLAGDIYKVNSYLSYTGEHHAKDGNVVITVRLPSFRDILPVLEMLTDRGYDFDETDDYPAANERSFISKQGISVKVYLSGDSTTCRRIIVGYEPQRSPTPIYGFDCGDSTPNVKI
jgi:hypothetical protein